MYKNPQFHIYDINSIDLNYLKDKSGLYFAKSKSNILYIGKSINLGKRLNIKFHHILKNNLSILDEIYVYEIDKNRKSEWGSDILGIFEKKLIKKFQPKLNIKETQHELNQIMNLANKRMVGWKVIKDGIIIDVFESGTKLSDAFNGNTKMGRKYLNENRYNKLCTSDLPKLKKGEIIKGISLIRLT